MKGIIGIFSAASLIVCCIISMSCCTAQDGSTTPATVKGENRTQPQGIPGAGTHAEPITIPGDYAFRIDHGGATRMYRVHVPRNYSPDKPAPMLFSLHGAGGNMSTMANDSAYGQISKSEQEGAIVVFPNGTSNQPSGKRATWNAGKCCGYARDSNADDVGYIRQIFADLIRRLNIDRSRIHAAGMSNGGMMSYRLACEMPDVFTSIAAVAGTDNTRGCSASRAVSVLHIHAKNDPLILFDGGLGDKSRENDLTPEISSVSDTISKWVMINGCPQTPHRELDNNGAYCDVYAPCRDNARVKLCVTEAGGHSWPGGSRKKNGEMPSQAISASEAMWKFFKKKQ